MFKNFICWILEIQNVMLKTIILALTFWLEPKSNKKVKKFFKLSALQSLPTPAGISSLRSFFFNLK
jgi:hypothetical protein